MTSCDVTSGVRQRYSKAAKHREDALCCPVDYDARYLKAIPQEVIDRDYGCGDPSRHLHEGETVLDLGCGGGKICFIASQVVGPHGRVIGVDMNDDMLELARRSAPQVARSIGYDNVEFRKGKIQDLAVDRAQIGQYLHDHPVRDEASLQALETLISEMRREHPMIADGSVDAVVSNCVLNLVDTDDKELLFDELFRVLRPGGRAVISDIVSDMAVPHHLQADPELWSGCLAGAFELEAFFEAFEQAGLIDVRLDDLQSRPWRIVEGISFRSATVIAYRPTDVAEGTGETSQCDDEERAGQSPPTQTPDRIYRGPFRYTVDDQGVMFTRGQLCCDAAAVAAARPSLADQFLSMDGSPATDNRSADSSDHPAAEAIDSPEQTASLQPNHPGQSTGRSLPTAGGGCCGDQGCC